MVLFSVAFSTTHGLFSNDGSEFAGTIYQKVNDQLETAVNLAWTAGSNGTRFGIGAKYQLDSNTSLSVGVSLRSSGLFTCISYVCYMLVCVEFFSKMFLEYCTSAG